MSEFPPHNREAEEAVIGSMLINPDNFFELAQYLSADDFYIVRHRWIWEAFERLQEKHIPVDFLTITEEIDNASKLLEIGGAAYLTALLNQVPTSIHAVHYANIVRAERIRRNLLSAANAQATRAYDYKLTVSEAVGDSATELQKIAENLAKNEHGLKSVEQLATEHYKLATDMHGQPDTEIGIMTRLVDLDKLLGGYGLRKKFVIIAGRPGAGKTSLALQISLAAARSGKRVAIFSLDMDDAAQITNVFLSMMSGVDSQRLEVGKLTVDEVPRYRAAIDEYSKLPIHIDDTTPMSVPVIRAKCMAMKATDGLGLVVVDYLLLVEGHGTREENDRADLLTRDFKLLKKELDVPLIVVHHTNRAIEKRADDKPILSDLNEGGEKNPDIVMVVHEPKDTFATGGLLPRKITFTKHRGGSKGTIDLLFNGPCTTFLSAQR